MKVKLRIRRFIVIAMLLIMILTGIGGNVIGVKANEIATSTDAVELSMPTDGEKIEEKEEVLPETVEEQEEKLTSESIFNAENFDIKFKLDNVWQAGYNATVTIYNTSDKIIENWCLAFPLNEEISNIWNANINKEHDDYYIIKNAGWNQDIAVGGNISFGITVCEPFTEFPEYYTMIGNELETKTEDYTIDYKITEDWGDGYKAEVTITNNRDTAIEDWRISFDYGDNVITQIWSYRRI